MNRDSLGDKVFMGFVYLLMGLLLVVMLYPFWDQFVLSFSTREAALRADPRLFPWPVDVSAYQEILGSKEVWRSFLNTIFRVVSGTAFSVTLIALTAYPLSRDDFPFKGFFTGVVLFTMLFSGGLIPSYLLRKDLNLINNPLVLILPGIAAYNLIIVRNFFRSLPREMQEAAQIDGATDLQIWWEIVLPLSRPVLATVALWVAVGHWNAYFDALIYLTDRNLYVLQVVLRRILLENQIEMFINGPDLSGVVTRPTDETVKAALVMVSTIPIVLVYPFVQRYFIKGVMLGSIKG